MSNKKILDLERKIDILYSYLRGETDLDGKPIESKPRKNPEASDSNAELKRLQRRAAAARARAGKRVGRGGKSTIRSKAVKSRLERDMALAKAELEAAKKKGGG